MDADFGTTIKPPPTTSDAPANLEEDLVSGEARRQAGNRKFRTGDIAGASEEYEQALKLLSREKFAGADEALIARVKECRTPAKLNMALCCLKADPPEGHRALELCEEVLEVEPNNAKATFRKGRALVEIGEFAEAEYEFVQAVKLAPGDLQIRKDLEELRKFMREQKVKEKETYKGMFSQGPGFASDGRTSPSQTSSPQQARPTAPDATDYKFIYNPKDNVFLQEEQIREEGARKVANEGSLEEAIQAWEGAIQQTSDDNNPVSHFSCWLELGRLFMDLNVDALALRCINKVTGPEAEGVIPQQMKANALILRGVCLLNEVETDALGEVSACLENWLDAVGAGPVQGDGPASVEDRLDLWRQSAGGSVADTAVAQGLLDLLHGREEALQDFADALMAPLDESCCFGGESRYATRWNMLGAVFANRNHHKQALVAYAEALKLQPVYPRAITNRGIAFQASGDSAGAAHAYVAALELVPDWAAPVLWELLRKTAQDLPGTDVAEAVSQKSLAGVGKLLGTEPEPTAAPKVPVAEVLARMGMSVSKGPLG